MKETLAFGLAWPYDYGFIPRTRGDDGDPLDILVLMDNPTFPGCALTVRLLGSIGLKEDGVKNDRFGACFVPTKETSLSTDGYRQITDLPDKLVIELTGCAGVRESLERLRAGEEAFRRGTGA